jgi:membrane-bound inhibitor of C-type lysozyme
MNQPLQTLLGVMLLGWALPLRADSTQAYCQLSRHDHTLTVEAGPCNFSQRQGNASVMLNGITYHFASDVQGKTYQRSASTEGIRFNREGEYNLTVLWRIGYACGEAIQKPVSAVFLNNTQPPRVDLAVGDQHVLLLRALSGSGARYTGQGVELWEHQGSTQINWFGTKLTCTN